MGLLLPPVRRAEVEDARALSPHLPTPMRIFPGIRNLSIDGLVTGRGKFRAETILINLHRLQMGRFDEDLPRIMRTSKRIPVLNPFPDRPKPPSDAGQWHRYVRDQIAMFGLGSRTTFGPRQAADGARCR